MISTKGRYALRVMLDLAECATTDGAKFVSLESIAKRQGISKKYLEIIIKSLVKENLLKGMRGKNGGYRLTRSPAEYTVGEILSLTEANLAVVACLTNNGEICERQDYCLTRPMWEKFDRMTGDFFFGITLEDLLKRNI